MLFDPIVLFFVAGIIVKVFFRKLHVPHFLNVGISSLILITIGLKGGIELCTWACNNLIVQIIAVVFLSIITYYFSKIILKNVCSYSHEDALVIAAHYGSVSVTTFAVGMAILQSKQIPFESYMPLFVALMELPAVIVAALEQHRLHPQAGSFRNTLLQTLSCRSILILIISMVFGYFFSAAALSIFKPLFDSFRILLGLLLFEMGILVGNEFALIKKNARLIISASLTLTLLCALCGMLLGVLLGLSQGGVILLTLLASSASYIAVPAVLRKNNPSARISLALGHSLGVTFPFNIFIGIYLYIAIVRMFYS